MEKCILQLVCIKAAGNENITSSQIMHDIIMYIVTTLYWKTQVPIRIIITVGIRWAIATHFCSDEFRKLYTHTL